LLLTGCAPTLPVPTSAPVDGGSTLRHYPRPDAEAVVVLVPGLGTNGLVWDLPGTGGLGPELWFEGHEVWVVHRLGPNATTLSDWASRISAALRQVATRATGRPVFAVGHGLGGTALLDAAASDPGLVKGVAAFGAPLALREPSRALSALVRALRERPGSSWEALRTLRWEGPRGPRRFESTLLTRGLPADTLAAFYRHATVGMTATPIESLPVYEPAGAAPELARRLGSRADLPVLLVLSPAAGLWPTWACDPAAFGVRRPGLVRRYVTRANGAATEYDHLDLLLHPGAGDDVLPLLVEWLDATRDRTAGGSAR